MKPAYCKEIKIRVEDQKTGEIVDCKYDLEQYFKSTFSDNPEAASKADINLQKQRDDNDGLLAGHGVDFDIVLCSDDLFKVYYIPLFKRQAEPSASSAQDVASGNPEVMMIAGKNTREVITGYEAALGAVVDNVRKKFNMSDPRVFDLARQEPRLKYLKSEKVDGKDPYEKYPLPKSGGFEMAGVIGWRKVYLPTSDANTPPVDDFLYITDNGQGNLLSWAKEAATSSKQIGVIYPKKGKDTWHEMNKDEKNDPKDPKFVPSGTHFILDIQGEMGSFDGNFDWKNLLLPAVPLAGLAGYLLHPDPDPTPTPTPGPTPVPVEKNKVYANSARFFVLGNDYLNKYGIETKLGELADFDSKYKEWIGNKWLPWDGASGVVYYGAKAEGELKINPAECNYAVHQSNGVRIDFDGRWSSLPALPEFAGIPRNKSDLSEGYYADDYFGRFDFVKQKFGKISTGENGALAKPLTGSNWLDTLKAGGNDVPLISDGQWVTEDGKIEVSDMKFYAMYTLKLFVGYYVYDYNFSAWSQLGEGYWVNYGSPFPEIKGYNLPSSDKNASGSSLMSYVGKWIVSNLAPFGGSNVFGIDSAKIIKGAEDNIPTYATSELGDRPAITAPTYVYAAYQASEMTFIWYVYQYENDKTDSGKWVEFYKKTGVPLQADAYVIDNDGGFRTEYENAVNNDAAALSLLDGRYSFSGDWLLIKDNADAPTDILKTGDPAIANKGETFTYDDFKQSKVKTQANSNRATYCFYAIYDPNKSYEVRFYVVSKISEGKIQWEEVKAPSDAKWSKIVSKEEVAEDKPFDIKLPSEFDKAKVDLTDESFEFRGKYEFANAWYVRKGADEKEGYADHGDFDKASLWFESSSLGYELDSSILEKEHSVVNGLVDGDNDKLALMLDEDATETVYKLYAIYDKIYTVKFKLFKSDRIPKTIQPKDWDTVFEAPIKPGQTISYKDLSMDGKTLGSIISGLDSTLLNPQWDLTGGNKYEFSGCWYNPDPKDQTLNCLNLNSAFFKFVFTKFTESTKSDFEKLWNFNDEDNDNKYKAPRSVTFSPESDDLHVNKEESCVEFYGVCLQSKKQYTVTYYVPKAGKEGEDPTELEWEKISEVTDSVKLSDPCAYVSVPDMSEATVTLNAMEGSGKDSKPRVGTYEFSWMWNVAEKTDWFSGIKRRKSHGNDKLKLIVDSAANLVADPNSDPKSIDFSIDFDGIDEDNRDKLKIMLNDEEDTVYNLYAVYDKTFEVEFYIIGDKYEKIPDGNVFWSDEPQSKGNKPVCSGTIKEGQLLSVEDIKYRGSDTIRMKHDNLRKDENIAGIAPIWGLEGGKTYLLLDAWFNPSDSDSDDMSDPAAVSEHCFAGKEDDGKIKAAWDLLKEEQGNMRRYNTKGAAKFNPYDDEPNFHVDKKDGKIKFYALYLPASGVEYMFYVVKDFAEEQFEWAPYEFSDVEGAAEQAVHTVEYKKDIPDPDKIKPVPDVPSTKTIAGSTIAAGGSNKLVFKGWRRIDSSDFLKTSTKAEECFDVNDDSAKDLLYACACQRVAKKSLVEKDKMYWNKGGFVSPMVSEANLESPFIYVAVYEYQQSFIDFVTTKPAYANLSVMASAGYAYGDTDTINKLIEGQIELSAGKGWELSVERFKYRYNPALPGVVANGASNKYTRTLGEDSGIKERAIDIHEGAKGDSKSVFSRQDFECAVWWITNPSGYVMPVGFYTKGMGEFSMPAKGSAVGTAPSFTPQSSSSSGNSGDGSGDDNSGSAATQNNSSRRRR